MSSQNKVAAIYNVWDGAELLRASMLSVADGVDVFIIVFQTVSNFGEHYDPHADFDFSYIGGVVMAEYEPTDHAAFINEKAKRNLGLDLARANGCTHFLHMDCDEMYIDFVRAKQMYFDTGAEGSVCKMFTYFKKPTLRLKNVDNYWVPFIHALRKHTRAGGKEYPFYVDHTRRINSTHVVEIDIQMHHFSWVRKNIKRKADNSSANRNIKKSQLVQDYLDPNIGAGSILVDYQNQELIEVADHFNLEQVLNV